MALDRESRPVERLVGLALPLRGPDPLVRYARTLAVLDASVLALAGVIGMFARDASLGWAFPAAVAAAVVVVWLIALAFAGAYDTRFLGVGTSEFARVVTASVVVLAGVATVGYVTGAVGLRGELLVAIPLGLILVLVERRLARAWLHTRRARGEFTVRALAIGSPQHVDALAAHLAEDPSTGLAVMGRVSPESGDVDDWVSGITRLVTESRVDAIVVAPGAEVPREALRALAWRFAGTGTQIMVGPVQGDIAGPRAVVRNAPRLPLVYLEEARLSAPQQILKRTGDLVASCAVLILMFPVLMIAGAAVKMTSPGPAFFRQQRVGRNGRVFTLTKIRTMVDGADEIHWETLGPPVGRDTRLTARDPRITGVGRFLRRWSLDEYPQLWSVIRGDMSLVGPRPLMPSEMPWLEPLGQRRHLMRPGITGLWQVNGRKELDWADRIRLDVEYVERWSPALDVILLLRTVKAVLVGDGAH